jgi:hypothetical protein
MSDTNQPRPPSDQIRVNYGNDALQLGIANIPRVFTWFWEYLAGPGGERLELREMAFLQYILDQNGAKRPTFHLYDLPISERVLPLRTREVYVAKYRAMGILYTRSVYRRMGDEVATHDKPPSVQVDHVEWFLEPLFFNLSLVYSEWLAGYNRARTQFGNAKAEDVYFRLPDDFVHTVVVVPSLAPLLAEERDGFPKLKTCPAIKEQAQILVAGGTQAELSGFAVSTQKPYSRLNSLPSVRLNSTHGKEKQPWVRKNRTILSSTTTTKAFESVTEKFRAVVGLPEYVLTERESRQVASLFQDGFSLEIILTGIEQAKADAMSRNSKIETFAYCVKAIRRSTVTGIQPLPHVTSSRTVKSKATRLPAPEHTYSAGETPVTQSDLASLAQGDEPLLALLQLVQSKNAKPLDEADAKGWRRLIAEALTVRVAAKEKVSPVEIVEQAVLEAISAGSVKENFLYPSMPRAILRTWDKEGRTEDGHSKPLPKARPARTPAPPIAPAANLQFGSLHEYEAKLGLAGNGNGNGESAANANADAQSNSQTKG